ATAAGDSAGGGHTTPRDAAHRRTANAGAWPGALRVVAGAVRLGLVFACTKYARWNGPSQTARTKRVTPGDGRMRARVEEVNPVSRDLLMKWERSNGVRPFPFHEQVAANRGALRHVEEARLHPAGLRRLRDRVRQPRLVHRRSVHPVADRPAFHLLG